MVRNYVLSFEDAQIFLDKAKDLVEFLLPRFTSEGKSYVGIAIGCTGGKHRSVVMTEEIGNWLKNCLLYTSPSPRDRTRSRMPSSA